MKRSKSGYGSIIRENRPVPAVPSSREGRGREHSGPKVLGGQVIMEGLSIQYSNLKGYIQKMWIKISILFNYIYIYIYIYTHPLIYLLMHRWIDSWHNHKNTFTILGSRVTLWILFWFLNYPFIYLSSLILFHSKVLYSYIISKTMTNHAITS